MDENIITVSFRLAIEVGIEMACGRATISARFAMSVLEYLEGTTV